MSGLNCLLLCVVSLQNDAPNWELTQSTTVNGQQISVFVRKRPRGEWQNMRLNGVVAESPLNFVKSLMSFDKRRQWEATFEDAVLVDVIDIGEGPGPLLQEEDESSAANGNNATAGNNAQSTKSQKLNIKSATVGVFSAIKNTLTGSSAKDNKDGSSVKEGEADCLAFVIFISSTNPIFAGMHTISLPDSIKNKHKQSAVPLARATDDVYAFLETVDLAGIPHGMAIAFLNDPDRQHALAHLRKQMMLSNPQECMLCQTPFDSATDIRFCPCCAMVSCAGCVSKRVFEVVSRNVMNVCVHCYRESSRIFQPPQAVQDSSNLDEALKGKWWRPEELGIVDYSTAAAALPASSKLAPGNSVGGSAGAKEMPSLYNDQDMLVVTAGVVPLIPGLLDDLPREGIRTSVCAPGDDGIAERDSDVGDGVSNLALATTATETSDPKETESSATINPKLARCKNCGLLISRDMEAIEQHMEECLNTLSPSAMRTASVAAVGIRASTVGGYGGADNGVLSSQQSYTITPDNNVAVFHGNHKQFAGIARKNDLAQKHATRIIYRTARSNT
jgi:hypothetical protein